MQNISLFLLPYIEKVLPIGAEIKEALLKTDNSVSVSFFERMMNAYSVNKEYLLLCLSNGVIYAWLLIKRQITYKSVESKFLLITLLVPLFMALAGRFAVYYSWMCYIPSVICLIYMLGKHGKRIFVPVICGLATLTVVLFGLPKTLVTVDKKAYKNVESFILKQNFSDKDKIISPFTSYYAVRNITKTCYFTGVYPLTLVPEDTKYILTAKDDYGSENMDIYIKQCEAAGKKVSVIDSLASPQMKLYIVE